MALILRGPSAVEALRIARYEHRLIEPNKAQIYLRGCAPTSSDASLIARFTDPHNPVHLSVTDQRFRRDIPNVSFSVHSGRFKAHSLVHLDRNLWCSSPNLAFLEMHGFTDAAEILALGFEFCGTYSRKGTDSIENHLTPSTTAAKIKRYLSTLQGARYKEQAMRNAQLLLDGSASVRETQLSLLLSLPYRLGGYGLKNPVLNRPIDVSPATHTRKPDLRATDISWKGSPIAVEYDSDTYHAHAEKITADAQRRTLLQSIGFEVVVVTNRQFKSISEMDRVAKTIARLLRVRMRTTILNYESRKRELHRRLLEL